VTQNDGIRSKEEAFVDTVIEKLKGPDTAFGAALRRADNPDTEYQCWDFLCRGWGRNQIPWCDITKSRERKPYALIGAALARAKPDRNGNLEIGRAIARCYSGEGASNGNEQPAAKVKLRRLLTCDTTEEACGILRSLLGLIRSRGIALNYAGLLKDLLSSPEYFNEHIKVKWARDFYYKKEEE
jgi:CRISPR system Cascade subunit CasB